MMEELSCSETLVLTRVTGRNNAEAAILHSHQRENLKSYIVGKLMEKFPAYFTNTFGSHLACNTNN
jgi:hypothetical protein